MSQSSINKHADLVALLERLNAEPVDIIEVGSLKLFVPDGLNRDDESRDLLWQILSHPSSKISTLNFTEEEPDALVRSQVLKVVKRWCQEVTVPSRELCFTFRAEDRGESRERLDDLREILQLPNNGVTGLWIEGFFRPLTIFHSMLHPVLAHPNNELTELAVESFQDMDDNDARTFSLGVSSQHSKLKVLELTDVSFSVAGILQVLDGLYAAPCLTRLYWCYSHKGPISGSSTWDRSRIMSCLTRLLERPGNEVKELKVSMATWDHNHVALFAAALTSEHCRLEVFDCGVDFAADSISIINALRHPNNRLKQLRIIVEGVDSGIALGKSLESVNCKLESLDIRNGFRHEDGRAVESIAEALRVCPTNRLNRLRISAIQPVTVFHAFTDSLRSSNNKLTYLYLQGLQYLPQSGRRQFYRTVRMSNLVHFMGAQVDSFGEFFNHPSMQVIYTMVSLKYVSRLGRDAWVRILPVSELIWTIATTLGWPVWKLSSPLEASEGQN